MEDIFDTQSELQEEQNTEETTENVVELTDELADNHLSEMGLSDDTEKPKENEEKPKADKLNPYEKIILAEMERRATEGDTNVADALNSKDKNIHGCFEYVKAQAKKKAVAGCAMIEDSQVYAWAHHYYIEPKSVIDAEMHPKTKTDTPAKGAETAKGKPTKGKKGDYSNIIPMATKSRKKAESKINDKVTTKKVGDRVFTITEFSLF